MVFLVRHARPASRPDAPPQDWELDTAGRLAAESLRQTLPPGALLVSSHEPKARQTLEPSGDVHTDARFNEVRRDEPYDAGFRVRRRAYVSGVDHPGWEPRRQVVARFAAGVNDWTTHAGRRPLVIATHGMAMTLWLAAVARLADPGAFWAGLRLPDIVEIDPTTGAYRRHSAPDCQGGSRGA